MKQKILGLKTDDEKAAEKQAEREQALAEIEKCVKKKACTGRSSGKRIS